MSWWAPDFFAKVSLWQTPHGSTFTRACLRPGSGTPRLANSHSPPGLLICADFIFMVTKSLRNGYSSLSVHLNGDLSKHPALLRPDVRRPDSSERENLRDRCV